MELKDIEDFKNKYNADLFFNTDIKNLIVLILGVNQKSFLNQKIL